MAGESKHSPLRQNQPGLTLVECTLAMAILSMAFLAVISTATVGHEHLAIGTREFSAQRLSRDLMEEIVARPYRDPFQTDVFGRESGEVSRVQFDDVNDYHNHTEAVGQQRDLTGTLYPAEQQAFQRRVTVAAATQSILSRTYTGVLVTVTVEEPQGKIWQLTRFIPEPLR